MGRRSPGDSWADSALGVPTSVTRTRPLDTVAVSECPARREVGWGRGTGRRFGTGFRRRKPRVRGGRREFEDRGSTLTAITGCRRPLSNGAIDVQVTTAATVPAYPFRWKRRVAAAQRSEPQMVPAAAQDRVATRQLAADAMARSDPLGIEPLAQSHGSSGDPVILHSVSNHRGANLSPTASLERVGPKGPVWRELRDECSASTGRVSRTPPALALPETAAQFLLAEPLISAICKAL